MWGAVRWLTHWDSVAVAEGTQGIEQPLRAAELVAALSVATDLGTGQPLEHAVRSAVLAVRLGELAGASAEELADTYYVALLHASGCTSNGHEAGLLFGDDIAHRAAFYLIDPTKPEEVLEFYRSFVGLGRPPEIRAKMLEQAIEQAGPRARESLETMCEVAQRFAGWLGLRPSIKEALGYVFSRWDGLGLPAAAGEQIPLSIRLLHVAKDASLFVSASGPERACAVLRDRSGSAYEPRLAELSAANLEQMLAELDELRLWDYALAIEPSPPVWLHSKEIDAGFAAIAAITQLKSPWLREHCTAVAELAEAAAWRAGLDEDEVALVRRAALAHDLGRVGVPNAIWEKPSGLSFGEWERVRLHAHYTERAFAQSPALAHIGRIAGAHHERCDGSGYHRGTRSSDLDRPSCIIAAADCYVAMLEARPHRPALGAAEAEATLLRDAAEGRLEQQAVSAVLAAAGHSVSEPPRDLPAGLTPRELEVLLTLVRGASNQEIADALGISAKTVGHHVQHIYEKAGVRTRAAATMWAFEQDLVHAT